MSGSYDSYPPPPPECKTVMVPTTCLMANPESQGPLPAGAPLPAGGGFSGDDFDIMRSYVEPADGPLQATGISSSKPLMELGPEGISFNTPGASTAADMPMVPNTQPAQQTSEAGRPFCATPSDDAVPLIDNPAGAIYDPPATLLNRGGTEGHKTAETEAQRVEDDMYRSMREHVAEAPQDGVAVAPQHHAGYAPFAVHRCG